MDSANTFGRRAVLGGLAALPFLAPSRLLAQAAAGPVVANIALENERVWVGATIAGSKPLLFIIDTGAVVSLIQPSVRASLGLRSRGVSRMIGIGGREDVMLYEARDVVLGGAIRQPRAIFAEPRANIPLHPDAAGLLAAGMLTSIDSELDFDAGEWRVYPGGRGVRTGFAQLPSEIRGNAKGRGSEYIFVDAEIDGRTYKLLADTGMPPQIALFGNATRRSGLWNDSRPFVPIQPSGIGGLAARGRLVRASRVSLGPIAFERPLVSLSQDVLGQSLADGIIGLELLERLTLSTDIAKGRLWARRNARAPRPERYGLSGLWMDERNGKVVVAVVSPASPASEAGLAVGDEILGGPLSAQIARLAGRPGKAVELRTRRNNQERTAKLVLREFI